MAAGILVPLCALGGAASLTDAVGRRADVGKGGAADARGEADDDRRAKGPTTGESRQREAAKELGCSMMEVRGEHVDGDILNSGRAAPVTGHAWAGVVRGAS